MCDSLDRGWGAWALVHLSEESEDAIGHHVTYS